MAADWVGREVQGDNPTCNGDREGRVVQAVPEGRGDLEDRVGRVGRADRLVVYRLAGSDLAG